MEIQTKTYETPKGLLEGVQVRWHGFQVLLVAGSKGFLACGVFDLTAVDEFGAAAAIVDSGPEQKPNSRRHTADSATSRRLVFDDPGAAGNLDRFPHHRVRRVNARAAALGIKVGMAVKEAFALIA